MFGRTCYNYYQGGKNMKKLKNVLDGRYKFMTKNPQACLWDESPFSYFLFTLIRHIRV